MSLAQILLLWAACSVCAAGWFAFFNSSSVVVILSQDTFQKFLGAGFRAATETSTRTKKGDFIDDGR